MLSNWFFTGSAAVVAVLGAAHLFHTYFGAMLLPRDAAVVAAMQTGQLVITNESTVWRAWLGFNASHSLGALLFGAVYGYLPWAAPQLWARSNYLLALGGLLLSAYVVLAWQYWFRVPLVGLGLALVLYLAGVATLINTGWPHPQAGS